MKNTHRCVWLYSERMNWWTGVIPPPGAKTRCGQRSANSERVKPLGARVIDYSALVSVHYSRSLQVLLLCVVGFWIAACSGSSGDRTVPAGAKSSGGKHAMIETDKGAIEIEFFPEDAPKAVENFRLLAEHGYYTA